MMGTQMKNRIMNLAAAAALAAGSLILAHTYCDVKLPACFTLLSSFVTAVSVNMIKALRLYLVLFGNVFSFYDFLRVYAKVSVLNLILPFKIGELFRGYDLGRLIHSYPDGYLMAVLDRFVDTLGIVTVFLFSNMILHKTLGSVFVILLVFLVIVIMVYELAGPLYSYWNHFLIIRKNSANTLKALAVLEYCNRAYQSAERIIRGRFGILYMLSLAAWLVEAGNIYLTQGESTAAEKYLSDILLGRPNDGYFFFLVFSLIFLGMMLLCGTVQRGRKAENGEREAKKKSRNEDHCNL